MIYLKAEVRQQEQRQPGGLRPEFHPEHQFWRLHRPASAPTSSGLPIGNLYLALNHPLLCHVHDIRSGVKVVTVLWGRRAVIQS